MRVYVVGAGAVGTYLGELLEASGASVTYAPRALDDVVPTEIDLAIVAVKAYDTDGAVATLQRALGPSSSAVIATPQNGIGNEEKLAAAFGADRVVSCALTIPVDRSRDGRAIVAQDGGIAFAPVGREPHNWLIAAFQRSGLQVMVTSDYRALKWSKLTLNLIANASCAILNVLPERLVRMESIFALEIRALREARAVMTALGMKPVDLPRYPVRLLQGVVSLPNPVARAVLANRIAGGRGRKPPSLLLDLRAAKGQTEVEVLNGAVAAEGRRLGIKTPVNAVYARVLDDIAHMPQLWAKYRERPDVLEGEVRAEMVRQNAGAPAKAGFLRP
ncbi:MAG: ketopantoate reductase family protein [Candidatus Eremiobacteraeota bacterium]|nr:ketopantoate reductase family protein [Candidatus Eremiobacteraeota bacterium]